MIKKNIAIFASGEGTNAQQMIDYFKGSESVNVKVIVSTNKSANVLNRGIKAGIETLIIEKANFYEGNSFLEKMNSLHIDLIVLAGFLWKVPENLIKAFPNKIINIHPALLPKYGGKGMYGMNVHKAVVDAKEKQSGITIHFVNEHYDEGKTIAQYTCDLSENETANSLASKIHQLEHTYFSKAIEKLLS